VLLKKISHFGDIDINLPTEKQKNLVYFQSVRPIIITCYGSRFGRYTRIFTSEIFAASSHFTSYL